ncbi:MAG: DUF3822 family protein [Hymenobacteraceae bacterium]|nr:DUF3822 family protein [Hymenobacteraceae bacterium]MDX5397367.1 DUF3822 family protein [Hymenobacteraceae bacterium]MDX5443876.1 DUF3822 family protein [Hymenobacteraceae bacterium]MDX5513447.1 DUF3822 family protein [Hymenobacteraceae bacterium]
MNKVLYRLTQKLTDESFDVVHISDYNLYLSVSNRYLRVGVADIKRNKFLVLEDYELGPLYSSLQVVEQLRLIVKDHPFLQYHDWNQIRFCIKNQEFTLIPDTLYDAAAQADYLRLHCELDEYHDHVYTYHHAGIGAVNIFAINIYLTDWLAELYQTRPIKLLHQTSALIEGVLHLAGRAEQKQLFLHVEQNYLSILVVRNGQLEFCNIFHFISPEDFIYYIIFVMQELKLNPEQDPLVVWGDLTHDSELFTILRKYVRFVKLGQKPNDISYSYKFDDLFGHRYFDLYSIHLCD